MATLLGLLAAAPAGTSTRPDVPRMPSVAVGVVIFMSPVFATAAATKATVPLGMSNAPAFCLPRSSYTNVSIVICALAFRLNVVPSLKVMPSDELAAVCTTSLRKMSSLTFSGIAALLRVTVAVPVMIATLPIGSSGGCASAAGAAGSGAGAAGVFVAGGGGSFGAGGG